MLHLYLYKSSNIQFNSSLLTAVSLKLVLFFVFPLNHFYISVFILKGINFSHSFLSRCFLENFVHFPLTRVSFPETKRVLSISTFVICKFYFSKPFKRFLN